MKFSIFSGAVVGIAVAVTFLVVAFTITSIIFFSILKTHCSSSRAFQICDYKSRESNGEVISDCSYAPEAVGIQNINDHLQSSTDKFDSDDNNRDSFIETVILKEDMDSESTNKNSTSTIV